MLPRLERSHRIAVTGIAGGGKTVFLTSLLAQLAEADEADFLLHAGKHEVRLQGFQERNAELRPAEVFPLDRYREALGRQREWPRKTIDRFRHRSSFTRSDSWLRRESLTLLDFPGERLADAAIAHHTRFADWSDHVLGHFTDFDEYHEAFQPYLDLLSGDNPPADALARAYKRALAELYLDYKPLVTPSVFALDLEGQTLPSDDVEALAQTRLCGVAEAKEFFPLPPRFRDDHPEIAAHCQLAYQAYRQQVVKPTFGDLLSANRLVVLVDVPSLLSGNVGRYNDTRRMVHDLFSLFRTDNAFLGQLWRQLNPFAPQLERLAVVASKADLVAREDIENGRLLDLLRAMTRRARDFLPNTRVQWFLAAACRSTRPGGEPYQLIGRPFLDNPEREERRFDVSPLPEVWPDHWDFGDFRFPAVYPEAPANVQRPPVHFGLDALFSFLVL